MANGNSSRPTRQHRRRLAATLREQANVLAVFDDGTTVAAEIRVFADLIEDGSLSFAHAKRGLLCLSNRRKKTGEAEAAKELRTAAQDVEHWIGALASLDLRKGGA